MAYLTEDDKQKQNGQDPNAGQVEQSTSPGSSAAPSIVSSSGGEISQAGIGKGGAGGWTNIQSYLGANAGNQQGSANLLNNKVGGAFTSEASRLADDSNKARNDATQKINDNTMSGDQSKQNLNSLASQYNYKAPQSEGYNSGVNKMKNAYNYDYVKDGGPTSYAFGLNGKAQGYGSSLKNDGAFSKTMSTIYGDAAGGQLSQGQSNLQNQLDVNNPYLNTSRGDLSKQYDDLNKNIGNTVQDTTKYLGDQATTAQTRKNDLQNYLGTQKESDYKSVDDARGNMVTQNNGLASLKPSFRKEADYEPGGPRGNQIVEGIARGGTRMGGVLNNDAYYNYRGANPATMENIGGVDTERNRWNAINNVLGMTAPADKISRSDTDAKLGKFTFDAQAKHDAYRDWLWSAGQTSLG